MNKIVEAQKGQLTEPSPMVGAPPPGIVVAAGKLARNRSPLSFRRELCCLVALSALVGFATLLGLMVLAFSQEAVWVRVSLLYLVIGACGWPFVVSTARHLVARYEQKDAPPATSPHASPTSLVPSAPSALRRDR